jgi:protein disulfide-isomerase A1
MMYLFAASEPDRMRLRKSLYTLALGYYDSLTVALVDPTDYPDLVRQMGLKPGLFPAGAVHQLSNDHVYPYPQGQAFDAGTLRKWGSDVHEGRIKPWQPQEMPAQNIPGKPTQNRPAGADEAKSPNLTKNAKHDEL